VTTSSCSSSQRKEAIPEDKEYCIGRGNGESESTGCVVRQVMLVVVVVGTGWGLGVLAVMGE
jgi:hypothetical protein